MNQVAQVMMQARTQAAMAETRTQVLESVLCDYAVFYRAAETHSLKEIRDGLGKLMDKLQSARGEAQESAESLGRLASDLQVRLREEQAAEEEVPG